MTSDIARQKKDYEALKTLSVVLRIVGVVLIISGFFIFSPKESIISIILIMLGVLLGSGGRGIKIFAKYRFGLIKNIYLRIAYEMVILIIAFGLILFLIL